ncbi:MAG TPA: transketolase [Candidatus Eremiobacteraceae bacterium]|nr:transketolase [Candidatus Eremiobacteraceae bacterium]
MKTSATLDKAALDQLCVNTIRTLAMDAVQKADSGHPGTPMALAPLAYVLWTRHLRYNPKNPQWPDRDRFILSAGHACMLQYAVLYLTGYDLALDDIKNFRQWGSKTPGHPEYGDTPGVEVTTGPLGQGAGNGVGFGIAECSLASRFNKPGHEIVNHFTYVICSDGDMMEGVASEAASFAGHLQLRKLIYFYDDNHITIEGNTSLAFDTEDVCARFAAYGWHTQAVEDGNDLDAIDRAITAAKADERPSFIRIRTHIAYGAPHKQDTAAAHGSPLGEDEIRLTKKFYGWPEDAHFLVPEAVLEHMRQAIPRGEALESEWRARLDAYRAAFPDLGRQFESEQRAQLPQGWGDDIPRFKPEEGPLATRQASGKVMNAFAPRIPNFLGGAADLASSTDTYLKDMGDFERGNYAGRNFHFGVREHAMGAALNGMALHGGLKPFGSTFFIFSDYMRPPVRLACIMGINPIYVWTHDSIGLGEDGPTHQPIEQLASLRAMPNMTIMRPADANETAICWRLALEHREGPVGLVLTRQKLPVLVPEATRGAERGGYVLLKESTSRPDVILLSTGSEVHVCLEAAKLLAQQQIAARVVSLPCWQIFDRQPSSYRDEVLPPGVSARLAVEAASPFGWQRYVGDKGDVIGMTRFGASAPAAVLFKEFGFTPDNVAMRAKRLLA